MNQYVYLSCYYRQYVFVIIERSLEIVSGSRISFSFSSFMFIVGTSYVKCGDLVFPCLHDRGVSLKLKEGVECEI